MIIATTRPRLATRWSVCGAFCRISEPVGRAAAQDAWYLAILEKLGIKVFSATKARDRDVLGERVTAWIREHPELEVFDKVITQSSDAEFHCLTITMFYRY